MMKPSGEVAKPVEELSHRERFEREQRSRRPEVSLSGLGITPVTGGETLTGNEPIVETQFVAQYREEPVQDLALSHILAAREFLRRSGAETTDRGLCMSLCQEAFMAAFGGSFDSPEAARRYYREREGIINTDEFLVREGVQ